MSIQKIVIKSESSGKEYEIRVGKDGVAYCNCPAWKFQHSPVQDRKPCKHMKQAARELAGAK